MIIKKPKEGSIIIFRNDRRDKKWLSNWIGKANIDGVTYEIIMYDHPPAEISGYIRPLKKRSLTLREREAIEREERRKARQEYRQDDTKGEKPPF